jgi:ATP-dependent DNA helicase RecG
VDNGGGGYIIIGASAENGMPLLPVTGITKDSVDKISLELLSLCNMIEPRYIPIMEAVNFEGKELIVVWVPGGSDRPYKCRNKVRDPQSGKSYYIRKLNSTIKANSGEEKQLFSLSQSIPYDDLPNYEASVGNLQRSYVVDFLRRADSPLYKNAENLTTDALLSNMHLLHGPKEYLKPLNVALLFFTDRPDNFFRYAQIEVVVKPDPRGTGMIERYFYGPLDWQLINAMQFIGSVVCAVKVVKHDDVPEADRIYNYPPAAIEEVLANAIHHRSYQIAEPITVTVTPDRIEVLSLPGPDKSISDEDIRSLRLVSNIYRNRRIGGFLKELHLVEGRNTGVPNMCDALLKNGSRLPVFETDEARSYLRVKIFIHDSFLSDDQIQKEAPSSKRSPMGWMKSFILPFLA